MHVKGFVIAVLSFVAFGLAAIVAVGGQLGPKTQVHDDAVYYRVKVGLSHKGEPIDFDVVVGCGARVSSDGYSGASVDIYGWYPFVYAKAISGGHAVLLRTTVDGSAELGEQPCRGGTSTDGSGNYRTPNAPGVAADWLPILVWYEHADDLSHGLAYVTQDAYESPDAELEFHGATIEHATRADFERFLVTAPKNLMPRDLADSLCCDIPGQYRTAAEVPPEVVHDPRLAWPLVYRPYCSGVERIRLNEVQRAQVRALWPADHPRYWSVPGSEQPALSKSLFYSSKIGQLPPNYHDLYRYAVPDPPENRARRSGVFPMVPALALARLGTTTGLDSYLDVITIGDGLSHRGMLSCDIRATKELEQAVTGRKSWWENHPPKACEIDGMRVPSPRAGCGDGHDPFFVAFENDEYAITSTFLDDITL